jgi:hypothetical protein
MTINDNQDDLKSASDGGALTMMCERDEESQRNATTR